MILFGDFGDAGRGAAEGGWHPGAQDAFAGGRLGGETMNSMVMERRERSSAADGRSHAHIRAQSHVIRRTILV